MDRRPAETVRVEAFSDGVFAIAITLLSLELRVPHQPGVTLARSLWTLWPDYLAFVLSFLTVGVIWLNHHRLFTFVRHVDHGLLIWNGLLLMAVCLVPFSNAVLSEYLEHPGERTAAVVYSGTFVVVGAIFSLLWRHATGERSELLGDAPSPAFVRRVAIWYAAGVLLYVVAFVVAFFSAIVSVIADVLFAIFFALPAFEIDRPIAQSREGEPGGPHATRTAHTHDAGPHPAH